MFLYLYGMKYFFARASLFLFQCFIFCTKIDAQNADINLLKQINPPVPDAWFWKMSSGSAYPATIAIQGGLMAFDYFNDPENRGRLFLHAGEKLVIVVLTEGIKLAVNRPRPYISYPADIHPYDASETGKSFPSAHTSLAFNTAASLAIRFHKWYITVPAYAWATSVGYSRLYLGEHYPSDVLAGAALGIGSAYLVNWLDNKLWPRKKTKAVNAMK